MCCTLIFRRSSLIMKGMMHAATTMRSRIHKGPSTRTRRSPHIWFFTVMLRDLEKTALLTQGTMNVPDEGKVAAVTPLRQTVEQQTAKEMRTCVQACRHLPAYDGHGKEPRSRPFFASRGQDRTQVEESPERRAVSASSIWRPQRRTRRTGAECTDRSQSGMSSSSAVWELLRKAVRRGHMARQRLDALPTLEKERKEDVAKLMALTN